MNNFGMLKCAQIQILDPQNDTFDLAPNFSRQSHFLCWFENDFLLQVWSELKFLDEKSSTSVIKFEVPSPLPKVNKNQERWSKVSKAKQKWFPSKYFCSDDASERRRCCCPLLILDGAKIRESQICWKSNSYNSNVAEFRFLMEEKYSFVIFQWFNVSWIYKTPEKHYFCILEIVQN